MEKRTMQRSKGTVLALLTFNHLLEAANLSPEKVLLLRHQDKRLKRGQTLYRLWRYQPDEFRRYERTQRKLLFDEGEYIASFVIEPERAVLFVGLSRVMGFPMNTEPVHFDFRDWDDPPGSVYQYELRRDERFAEYEGKLAIDWGPSARVWTQRAHRQPKPITEIRKTILDVEWPGYMEVRVTDREVLGIAPNWQAKLAAANGVYLLTCSETGEQYVGAAFGADGFWGRWAAYANGGDGGNKLLRERKKRTNAPMQISILEIFGSTMTEDEAYAAESRWKLSLGSRAQGLNAN